MREPPEAFNADAAVQANAPGTTRQNKKEVLLKTAIANIWQKLWGKVFFAAIYSAASVLLYFALAEIAYGLWGSTIIPSIGQAPVQVGTKPIDPAEMQRLWQNTPYTGPGSPQYQPPASGTSH